jgi:hypothetical protein
MRRSKGRQGADHRHDSENQAAEAHDTLRLEMVLAMALAASTTLEFIS